MEEPEAEDVELQLFGYKESAEKALFALEKSYSKRPARGGVILSHALSHSPERSERGSERGSEESLL